MPSGPIELSRNQAFINGVWCGADDGASFAVLNPATGEQLAALPRMGAGETRRAIAAAEAALIVWRGMTAKERAGVMRRWSDLMLANSEQLAALLTLEQGKPLAESRVEIAYAASFLEWYGEEGKRVYGDVIPPHRADNRIVVSKQPVGVCAGITPWNFPSAMVTRKAAPALGAGCTMVLKPAEQTPLSALAIAALGEAAGLPPGVLSIVTTDAAGAPAIGAELTSNPTVRKLGFTGSTVVGKLLMAQCAANVQKVTLELGGNAPFIVMDDADLDAAIAGALVCKYRNTGQTCISANRIMVQDGVFDAFVERFTAGAKALTVGLGTETASMLGPLIDDQGLDKVEAHVADAIAKGATLHTGGARHALGQTFYQPTVLTGIAPEMAICNEETFGPVAGIMRFQDETEVLRMANDTPYGLVAYFYSRDVGRIWRLSEGLEYGMIGINTGMISTEVAPFGGIKESGIGRYGSHQGIDEYLEAKYMCMGGIDA
ncbi:MAG: NAD-dependent succinate-semialdehyde dehydrogenase [Rhodospirillaceae bacterium]|nr:NAD-dependent succinate-semialdehyde dehydrogenase [Rhodospirillaceae bacterium]MBT5779484.1 NAD-dependent succinate-semialdehyde dehydrogenase [Rhodospirillaceae bacterium]